MNAYDAAVTSWARKWLTGFHASSAKLVDWTQPARLVFDYAVPYSYSEHTNGGGYARIDVACALLAGGNRSWQYADEDELEDANKLPELIAAILAEATDADR